MAAISPEFLEALVRSADESLVKLQLTDGVPTWEAMPGFRHQRVVLRMVESVRRIPGHHGDCGCYRALDVYVRFSDGSFRAPDIALYCEEPPDVDGASDILPVAVVEVVSRGYELKDELALDFYLGQGVRDVVVYDPRTGEVVHATAAGRAIHIAPVRLELGCGCSVDVPV